ncbi:MAG: winged helix-turn-helix domain-containing protein [Clostridiales bacterium]|nr:winged helix-turn-helix domain-containing protein [Clostridiales bacterium]
MSLSSFLLFVFIAYIPILNKSEYKPFNYCKNINEHYQVLTRSQILENLWEIDGEFVDDNTLSVYIRRLREKIEDNPSSPSYIKTVRGVGYKWDLDVKVDI